MKFHFQDCNLKKQIHCDENCIVKTKKCDMMFDCNVKEDEDHCNANEYFVVKNALKETRCTMRYDSMNNLLTKIRYPFNEVFNCTLTKCKNFQYKCHEFGYCININRVCDGISHCPSLDDELFCG